MAKTTVALSGAICLLSPWLFDAPDVILIPALVAWGMAVVADSPHYSALAARHAPPAFVGTALSVQNGLGFGLTLVSIAALPEIADQVGWRWSFLFLAPGPLVALLAMRSFPMERPR